jgi:DNA-binding NtrC family response regulator
MKSNKTILVVDDDGYVRELLTDYFERFGITVSAAASGDEAQASLEKYDIRVALIDLKINESDGFAIMDRLKAVRPDLAVIIMTGFPTIESTLTALRRQVFDFVIKPFRLSELNHIVDKALQEAQPARPGELLPAEAARVSKKEVPELSSSESGINTTAPRSSEHSNGREIMNQLERLRERRYNGELTDREYEAQRLQLLEQL